MTTDYTTLTNEELDRMSGEAIMKGTLIERYRALIEGDKIKTEGKYYELHIPLLENENSITVIKDWHPTDPDSNQAEKYLFPKVCEKAKYDYGNHLSVRQHNTWGVELRLEIDSDPTEDDPFSLLH